MKFLMDDFIGAELGKIPIGNLSPSVFSVASNFQNRKTRNTFVGLCPEASAPFAILAYFHKLSFWRWNLKFLDQVLF